MVMVSPSILAADFANLERDIRVIEQSRADMVHVDVMDGCFVPNLTIGPCVISSLRKYSTKVFDVHLMIEEPIRYISAYRNAGADILTVHAEACSDLKATLLAIRESGAKVGLSIKPKTDPKTILPFLSLCDMLLVMTVEPGFGGQAFIPDAVENVRFLKEELRKSGLSVPIEVDGGITTETIGTASKAGAEIFVAGSAVYKKPDIGKAISELLEVAERS